MKVTIRMQQLAGIITESQAKKMIEGFKVGDKVRINKNITQYNKEAHGFRVGQEAEITSIDDKKQRARITPSNFSIAFKAIDLI
jgi:ribosomal protein L19